MSDSDPQKATLSVVRRVLGREVPQALSELVTLSEVLDSFGVVAAFKELRHPDAEPEACIKRASRHFDFMAFHGNKWLFKPWLRTNIERLRLREGRVRFLLHNSTSEESLREAYSLKQEFPLTFDLRIFSPSPIFRLVIIDDDQILIGHYGHEVIEEDQTNAKGWRSPQLYVEDNNTWSLCIPFRQLFEQTWAGATKLEDAMKSAQGRRQARDFTPIKSSP